MQSSPLATAGSPHESTGQLLDDPQSSSAEEISKPQLPSSQPDTTLVTEPLMAQKAPTMASTPAPALSTPAPGAPTAVAPPHSAASWGNDEGTGAWATSSAAAAPQQSITSVPPPSPPESRPAQLSQPENSIGEPNSPHSCSPLPETTSTTQVNSSKMEALNAQIAKRTAEMDAETKAKELKITAAAQEYLKSLKSKREKELVEAKASHKKEQQAGVKKIDEYKKSGAVWNAVGMLVDLQKPNAYSKGTEQMRSVLATLNGEDGAAK